MGPIAQRITRDGNTELRHRSNIARVQSLRSDLFLAAHQMQGAEAFFGILVVIPHTQIGIHYTRDHAQIVHLANKGIGCHLNAYTANAPVSAGTTSSSPSLPSACGTSISVGEGM